MHQAPQEESSDSTRLSSKRQRDKRPQLSDAMRARLGPQEPGKTGPPAAATWEAYPNPQSHPLFRTTSHTKRCDKPEGTHQMNHPPVPLAEDWMTCSPRLLAHILSITTPQGDSSCQNFLRMMGLVTPSTISCIIDNS